MAFSRPQICVMLYIVDMLCLSTGEMEANLLEAAKEIHLNACSVLSHFASHVTLTEYAVAQTTAQLRSLV